MKTHLKKGFTLIELLTVIAIIGILASILIPTVSKVRETARRVVDSSNLRQIGQASLIFANDNREALPWNDISDIDNNGTLERGGETDIFHYAAAVALQGGLNDANIWFSGSDTQQPGRAVSTVLDQNRTGLHTDFNAANAVSFEAWAGLNLGMASTTPIAVTRGLNEGQTGRWGDNSVYNGDGGHIVFLGGNVNFYRNLEGDNQLIHATAGGDQGRTSDILETVRANSGAILVGHGDGSFDAAQGTAN